MREREREREREKKCEFTDRKQGKNKTECHQEDNLVCKVSSRTARAVIQRNYASKINKRRKENKKERKKEREKEKKRKEKKDSFFSFFPFNARSFILIVVFLLRLYLQQQYSERSAGPCSVIVCLKHK